MVTDFATPLFLQPVEHNSSPINAETPPTHYPGWSLGIGIGGHHIQLIDRKC